MPLTVPPPPHVPPIEGFGVRVNGEEYTLGSTFSVEVPRCAIGPRHCDARHLTITAEACIFDECVTYTVVATIPAVSIPANDASMRAVNITAGSDQFNRWWPHLGRVQPELLPRRAKIQRSCGWRAGVRAPERGTKQPELLQAVH